MPQYQEQLTEKFNETYKALNAQQRIAVDTIEGPVMVIAGPGTGKTQILAARIGKILLDTDTRPENILCLTYTDAGTIAMRKRLQQFIGSSAYKVNIYTFHAFCNDVIQDNLPLFEKSSLDAISELETIELFKQLIDSFPKDHPLKRYRGDVYFEINNLRQLFSVMKREGWTPAFINEKIDAYISDLPQRDAYIAKRATGDFKKGDVRTDKIAEEVEKMEKLRAAVKEFDRFQQLMRSRNRYDFDDMINWVIRVFEEHKNVLSAYQEKFQYILVDEYQDTSGTQNRLVQLLISYWDNPNVFVVGDDDQSIYRFQGANVENMLEFANRYAAQLITVVLTNNYRSTQPILDASKALISKNQERLVNQVPGLSKELLAARESLTSLTHTPLIMEYHSAKEEMIGITNSIAELIREGVAPGRIAVIYKENRYGEELARYLRMKAVPVYSKRSINILELAYIKKILQILRYINAEHDIPYGGDEMLFEILHYDFYQVPPIEIAKLTVEVNNRRYKEEATSIRRLLAERSAAQPRDLFDTGINPRLKATGALLEKLIADVPNYTLQELFERLIQYGGLLPYIMESPDKVLLLQWLTALFDFIKSETSRNPSLTLDGFIRLIDLMEKEDVALPLVQVSGNENAVNLLTAHGSKGLEFEYVFFAGVTAGNWEKKRKPGGGYKFPDTIFSSAPEHSEEEELRRLFYVALTRAEKHLYISYARFRNDNKEQEPSMFIAEIQEEQHLPVEIIPTDPEAVTEFSILQLSPQAPEIASAEKDFIDGLLDKFAMNVTALNNYLDCPLAFYYKNLLRIPVGKSEATEFGSAVHHALEQFFRKMQENGKDEFLPAHTLYEDFSWYMQRHREHFTREAFNRRMEQGSIILPAYYAQYIGSWNKVVAVERNIRGVTLNGIPLKGKLDKLEFNGRDVNVVDYKTGNVDYALIKMKPPNDKEPNGGDYWRQAVFYKILIDNYEQKDWNVVSTEFDFIEPDKQKKFRKEKIVITPADMETVKQQVTDVWQKIRDRDFYTGCGKEDCKWCDFVKNNQLAVALHDIDNEPEN